MGTPTIKGKTMKPLYRIPAADRPDRFYFSIHSGHFDHLNTACVYMYVYLRL